MTTKGIIANIASIAGLLIVAWFAYLKLWVREPMDAVDWLIIGYLIGVAHIIFFPPRGVEERKP